MSYLTVKQFLKCLTDGLKITPIINGKHGGITEVWKNYQNCIMIDVTSAPHLIRSDMSNDTLIQMYNDENEHDFDPEEDYVETDSLRYYITCNDESKDYEIDRITDFTITDNELTITINSIIQEAYLSYQ